MTRIVERTWATHAAAGGLMAGVLFLGFLMVASSLLTGVDRTFMPLRMISAVVLGEAALDLAYPLTTIAIVGGIVQAITIGWFLADLQAASIVHRGMEIQEGHSLAHINRITRDGRYYVSIRGPLSVRDLGRLERVCGPALELREAPLDIRLTQVHEIDEGARMFLQRLADRGARISET